MTALRTAAADILADWLHDALDVELDDATQAAFYELTDKIEAEVATLDVEQLARACVEAQGWTPPRWQLEAILAALRAAAMTAPTEGTTPRPQSNVPQPRPWVVLERKADGGHTVEGWIKDAEEQWVGFAYRPASARLIVEAVNLLTSTAWVAVNHIEQAEAAALDVERLARALMTADPTWHGPWSDLLNADQDQWLDKAKEVSAHYAAILDSLSPDKEGKL